MATRESIIKCIGLLSLAYPHYQDKVNEPMVNLYVRMLSDLEDESLQLAAEHCIVNGKFFPSIAELREAAARIETGADILPSATEAWGEFCKITRRLGYFEIPVFDNPITAKVAQALGWKQLVEHDNESVAQAQFRRLYEDYQKRGLNDVIKTPALKSAEGRALEMMGGVVKQIGNGK